MNGIFTLLFIRKYHDKPFLTCCFFRTTLIYISAQFYLQISAIVHTSTFVHGDTLGAIKNKVVITLASFKTAFTTGIWVNKASTGYTTGVGAHVIVTVGRAGGSCKRRRHFFVHLKNNPIKNTTIYSANTLLCVTYGRRSCSSTAEFARLHSDMLAHRPGCCYTECLCRHP